MAVDWQLVLEFAKVLAAPLAAIIVARQAISSFRKQKLIERRLDWYGSIHRKLGAVGRAFARAGGINDAKQREREEDAYRAGQELAEMTDEAWLYAEQSGFEAIQRLTEGMASAYVARTEGRISFAHMAEQVTNLSRLVSNALANEMRKELRVSPVRPVLGITKTVTPPKTL